MECIFYVDGMVCVGDFTKGVVAENVCAGF